MDRRMFALALLAATLLVASNGFRVGLADAPPTQQAPPAPVVPGLHYQEFIQKNLLLLTTGKIDEAIDQLKEIERSRGAAEDLRDQWKGVLPNFLERAGPCTDRELVGLRRISSRLCTVYALGYFEHNTLLYTYSFEKVGDEWKISRVSFNTDLESLEKFVPLQPIGRE